MALNLVSEETKLTNLVLDESFFWKDFAVIKERFGGEAVILDEYDSYNQLFENLVKKVQRWISTGAQKVWERNLLIVKAGLLLNKPYDVDEVFRRLFQKSLEAFKIVSGVLKDHEDSFNDTINNSEAGKNCKCCHELIAICKCQKFLDAFTLLNSRLGKLRLIEDFSNSATVAVVYQELTTFIETRCKGDFFNACLSTVFEWMDKGLVAWLQYAANSYSNTYDHVDDDVCLTVEQWKPRLEFFVYKAFAELRVSELFEIIVDYPDSLPAITDLKECMGQTDIRQDLTESLKKSFENRLLHPAVNTDDILTQYVSAIRTLRELDPAGVILENVCTPLREYLRGRDDTIKCIITCLTDQETSPGLAEELFGAGDSDSHKGNESESDGEDWIPDPIDAKTDLSSKEERTADIINILVNIYGSQDMFVSQYRVLLADRILTNFSYDVTNERRYLELLKRRFGETHLHFCDIMLKDIQDSQRNNRRIKDEMDENEKPETAQKEDSIEFNSFIISAAFWPSLSEDKIEPPEPVQKLMDQYTEIFKRVKGGNRTLNWYLSVGSVELDVELEDSLKTFHVTPAQATLLLQFQERDEWTLNEISETMNLSKTSVRSRIAFWVGQGVIIEKENDVFIAATSFNSQMNDVSVYESDEDDSATSSQNPKDEELQVYWSYVTGMLTNLSSLSLERIYGMLKMFAMAGDSSVQCSLDDVKKFLQGKVLDGELIYAGGMYKLPPKSS